MQAALASVRGGSEALPPASLAFKDIKALVGFDEYDAEAARYK